MNPVIQLENITREFVVGRQIVRALGGINLDILVNEYVAVMGPSGSGKSKVLLVVG